MISDKPAQNIIDFFEGFGLNIYLIISIIAIILFVTIDLRKIKQWKSLPNNQKRFLVASIIGELLIITASILNYSNVL